MTPKFIMAGLGILLAAAGMAFGGNAYLIGSGVICCSVAHFVP